MVREEAEGRALQLDRAPRPPASADSGGPGARPREGLRRNRRRPGPGHRPAHVHGRHCGGVAEADVVAQRRRFEAAALTHRAMDACADRAASRRRTGRRAPMALRFEAVPSSSRHPVGRRRRIGMRVLVERLSADPPRRRRPSPRRRPGRRRCRRRPRRCRGLSAGGRSCRPWSRPGSACRRRCGTSGWARGCRTRDCRCRCRSRASRRCRGPRNSAPSTARPVEARIALVTSSNVPSPRLR